MIPRIHKYDGKGKNVHLFYFLQLSHFRKFTTDVYPSAHSFDTAKSEKSLSNCPGGVTSINNQPLPDSSLRCVIDTFIENQAYILALLSKTEGWLRLYIRSVTLLRAQKNVSDDEIEGGLSAVIRGICMSYIFIRNTDLVLLEVNEKLQRMEERCVHIVKSHHDTLPNVDTPKCLQVHYWKVQESKLIQIMEKVPEIIKVKGSLSDECAFNKIQTEILECFCQLRNLVVQMLLVESLRKLGYIENEKNKLLVRQEKINIGRITLQKVSEKINQALPEQVASEIKTLTQAERREVSAKDFENITSQAEKTERTNTGAKQDKPIIHYFNVILKTDYKRDAEKANSIKPQTDLDDISSTMNLKLQTRRNEDTPVCGHRFDTQRKQSVVLEEQIFRENATPAVHLGMKPFHRTIADFRTPRPVRHTRVQPPIRTRADIATRPRRDLRTEMQERSYRIASFIPQRKALPFKAVDIADAGLYYDEDNDRICCCGCSWTMPKKQFCECGVRDLTAVHSCPAGADATPPSRGEQLCADEGNSTEQCEASREEQATGESRKHEETEGAPSSDLVEHGCDFFGSSSKHHSENTFQEHSNSDDLAADAAEDSDDSIETCGSAGCAGAESESEGLI